MVWITKLDFSLLLKLPDAPGCVESLDMTDELESALSQAAETTGEEEVKKTKKNKKKKNNNSENNVDSSADDFKEVEVKPKKDLPPREPAAPANPEERISRLERHIPRGDFEGRL